MILQTKFKITKRLELAREREQANNTNTRDIAGSSTMVEEVREATIYHGESNLSS